MKPDLQQIFDILNDAESYRPVVLQCVDILNSYGPIFKQIGMDIALGVTDIKIATIAKYEAHGFTREQAIDLCMDEWYAFAKAARNANKGGGK